MAERLELKEVVTVEEDLRMEMFINKTLIIVHFLASRRL